MPRDVVDFVVMAGFGLLVLILVVWVGPLMTLHTRARAAGVPVTLVEFLGMRLRRVNARVVVGARIAAARAGIRLTMNQLEGHFLAGGRVPEAVAAMIEAHAAGIEVAWGTIAANDLGGLDLLEGVVARPGGKLG